MKIKIHYRNGRLDVFDTDTFTKSEPFPGTNLLTNFEVRLDLLGETGLWLSAHHYDSNVSTAEQAENAETPVARRKRGWRFLLAESEEVSEIDFMTIDEAIVLQRIYGELIDVMKLDETAQAWISGASSLCAVDKILELFNALAISAGDADADEIARACGCSFALVKALQAMRPAKEEEQEGEFEDDSDWMEGFDYEDDD